MPYVWRESEGGHTGENWRIYLSEFAPMILLRSNFNHKINPSGSHESAGFSFQVKTKSTNQNTMILSIFHRFIF